MLPYRNYTLEEIERERIAYRTVPAHYGKTYTELKAERRARMKVYQAFLLGCAVLLAVAVAVKSCVSIG